MEKNKNTVTRYSENELAKFEQVIEERLAKTRKELGYLQKQIEEYEETAVGEVGDQIDDSEYEIEMEMLDTKINRLQKYERDLENALVRIKNKTYGICSSTGKLIDKKRLMAVPTTTMSVEAKHARDAEDPIPFWLEEKQKKEKNSEPKIITKVLRKPKPQKSTPPTKPESSEKKEEEVPEEFKIFEEENKYREDINLDLLPSEDKDIENL